MHAVVVEPQPLLNSSPRPYSQILLLKPASCPSFLPAELHVYDAEKNYVPFDAAKPEPLFEVQRKLIPNAP